MDGVDVRVRHVEARDAEVGLGSEREVWVLG